MDCSACGRGWGITAAGGWSVLLRGEARDSNTAQDDGTLNKGLWGEMRAGEVAEGRYLDDELGGFTAGSEDMADGMG